MLFSLIISNANANDIKKHILDHIYEGCPTNSYCSKNMATIRKKWLKKLKSKPSIKQLNSFKSKHGIPIDFWSSANNKKDISIIYWDSHCDNHNIKNNKILLSQAFANNFKKLIKNKKIYIRQGLLANKDKLNKYFLIREDSPIYADGNKLIFSRGEEGIYYYISIDNKGHIRIVKNTNKYKLAKVIKCPKNMIESFKKYLNPKNLYLGYYCKAIWNKKNKKFQPIIMGYACT